MIISIYILQNYILKYIMRIIYIMSIIKSSLCLLRMGGAERMRRRATAGTLQQPGGYVSMFQHSLQGRFVSGNSMLLSRLAAEAPVSIGVLWRALWRRQCAPMRSAARQQRSGISRAPAPRRGSGTALQLFDVPFPFLPFGGKLAHRGNQCSNLWRVVYSIHLSNPRKIVQDFVVMTQQSFR